MKKQRNLSYHISILAFLFVMSTVMVTSSPFQMLLDVNPSFKSTLSLKLANAADDGGSSSDDDDGGSSSDDDDGGSSSDDDDGGSSSDDDDGGSSSDDDDGGSSDLN